MAGLSRMLSGNEPQKQSEGDTSSGESVEDIVAKKTFKAIPKETEDLQAEQKSLRFEETEEGKTKVKPRCLITEEN